MKVYSPSDIANLLKIKPATLRKYCIMLENAGYEFQKNSRQQRFYNDTDIIVLRKVITLKDNGMTLDEAIKGVVMWHKGEELEETDIALYETETHNATKSNNGDIKQLTEMIHKQNETIEHLVDRLDKQEEFLKKQQEYLDKRLNERDQVLMQALNQSLETQKQIAAAQENKSIWKKLFRKQ